MTISAKVICDSRSLSGVRLTTFQLRYPRFIHAELMTHRVFSRNASSSRAIPVARLIKDVEEDTAMPIHWGANQKGMQADEENEELIYGLDFCSFDRTSEGVTREEAWVKARDNAIDIARKFDGSGYHKQIVNRLLEPFSHINVIVTSTDWANWFALRDHPDAQPEIRKLAQEMDFAMSQSEPEVETVRHSTWHTPYVTVEDTPPIVGWLAKNRGVIDELVPLNVKIACQSDRMLVRCMVSAARCARVSYKTHDGKAPTVDQDIELFARLAGGEPLHASPLEHQARPIWIGTMSKRTGNFRGWEQFRKFFPNEFVEDELISVSTN